MTLKYDELRTFTGLTIAQALAALQQKLEPNAYKQVKGSGVNLTDIKPAYLTEVLTDVFGICPIGWSFDWENIELSGQMTTTSGGKDRYVWQADILRGWLSYTVTDGEKDYEFKVWGTGGSDNDVKEYAVRGAVTNMLGAAASKLLWQLPVYKGQGDEQAKPDAPAGKPAPQPTKVDERPWYTKQIEFARAHPADYALPLGQTEIGKAAIARLRTMIGADLWFAAPQNMANAIKKYTGFGKAEEMTWPKFERLVRAYVGPYAMAGEQIKDVLFDHFLKPASWQELIHAIPLEVDMVLDEQTAAVLEAALIGASAYVCRDKSVNDGKLDIENMAASLRAHFIKHAVDETPAPDIDMDSTESIAY
jgi:hypothetical protein